MKALNDKAELKARNTTLLLRNKAYKVTLEYCEETCDVVDKSFNEVVELLQKSELYNDAQIEGIQYALSLLNMKVKDQGTRKLRKAFTTYVLENIKDK